MAKKKKTVSKLKKDLDTWFSRYIRLRDSDDKGEIKCVTCEEVRFWKYADCGHYIPRQWKSTRWHEQNCHAQCKGCNGFQEGRMDIHRDKIEERYGKDVVDMLNFKQECEKRNTVRLYTFELEANIEKYKRLAKAEAKLRGLEI